MVTELVVLAYSDEPTARLVSAKVLELQRDRLIDGQAAMVCRAIDGSVATAGVDDELRAAVRDWLQPGMAGVVIVFRHLTPDKALAALAPYGGRLARTSLTPEAEARLGRAMAAEG